MNAKDRRDISIILERINEYKEQLEFYRDSEQEKFDNLNEGLQASEKGQKIERMAECLSEACDYIESATDALNEIFE